MNLEAIDRRAFLAGLCLTSAGLLVPRPVYSVLPTDADRLEAMLNAGMPIVNETFDLDRIPTVLNKSVHVDGCRFHIPSWAGFPFAANTTVDTFYFCNNWTIRRSEPHQLGHVYESQLTNHPSC